MGLLRLPLLLITACALAGVSGAQVFVVGMKTAEAEARTEFHPTRVELPGGILGERGRLGLIRDFEAEQGFAHREMPFGNGLILVANGVMTPRDEAYKQMLYQKGQAAAPGDRLEVTSLRFQPDAIVIDFNGGPYAKHRFLSHISINDMPIAQLGPVATGCRVTLVFEGGVPEVTAAEVKALLDPIVDFHAKTSAEAYADTLTMQVREAVERHHVLVGMDRRMVLAAMGEPQSRHREHIRPGDADSEFWEEWIYPSGSLFSPEATQFVRFASGRVIRVELAATGKPIEIHDKAEILAVGLPGLETRTIANGDVQPGVDGSRAKPSLGKPGEVPGASSKTIGKVRQPGATPQ